MSTEVVGLAVDIKLDGVLRELKRLKSASDDAGKDMVAALGKQVTRLVNQHKKAAVDVEQSSKKMVKASETVAKANDGVASTFGKVGESSAKLRGVLSLIPGPFGEIAGAVNDFADAGEVASSVSESMGVSLGSVLRVAGPVAIAVGALTLAWQHYEAALREAEAKQKQSADILADVKSLTDQVAEAKRNLAKAVGGESEILAQNQEIELRWQASAVKSNETLREKQRALQEAIAQEEEYISKGLGSHIAKRDELNAALANTNAEIKRNEGLAAQGAQIDKDAAEAARLRAEADERVAQAMADRAKAQAEAQRRDAELAAGIAEIVALRREFNDTLDAVDQAGARGGAGAMSAAEKVLADQQDALAQLQELRSAGVAQAVNDADRVAELDRRIAAARVEIERGTQAELDKLRDDAAARESERLKRMADDQRRVADAIANAAVGFVTGALGDVGEAAEETTGRAQEAADRLREQLIAGEEFYTEAQRAQIQKRIEAAEAAQARAFAVTKGVKVAEAAINTASAFVAALDDAPYPANLVLAGLSAAAGAAQIATIASTEPSYGDTPGIVKMQEGGSIALAGGDYAAAARSPQELRRKVNGSAPSQPVVLQMRLGHRVLDESVAQTIRAGGELQREVTSRIDSGPTGHER